MSVSFATEERIERAVERAYDRLDGRLMSGVIMQVEYDAGAKAINAWACEQYRVDELAARPATFAYLAGRAA
jgi:hypothetical protein